MTGFGAVFRREFSGYFTSPLAYVFLVIFLVFEGLFTFQLGQFYAREQADLSAFFFYQPWLFLFLIPAIAMRLWAEEKHSGTLELLFGLPISLPAMVLGKYLAALAFTSVAIALSFPIWLTVSWLGDPDHGVIIAGFLGIFLMAAAFLAIGGAVSAMTRNQITAFIGTGALCFLFLVTGLPIILDLFGGWAPDTLVLLVADLSVLSHFTNMQKGLIGLGDLFYFISLAAMFLWLTVLALSGGEGLK